MPYYKADLYGNSINDHLRETRHSSTSSTGAANGWPLKSRSVSAAGRMRPAEAKTSSSTTGKRQSRGTPLFGGYTNEEVAEIVGESVAKVHRDWEFARAWLYDKLAAG